jgi:hypothetical protein
MASSDQISGDPAAWSQVFLKGGQVKELLTPNQQPRALMPPRVLSGSPQHRPRLRRPVMPMRRGIRPRIPLMRKVDIHLSSDLPERDEPKSVHERYFDYVFLKRAPTPGRSLQMRTEPALDLISEDEGQDVARQSHSILPRVGGSGKQHRRGYTNG